MTISLGIKEPQYPEWVHAVYEAMSAEQRKFNTLTNIYTCCKFHQTENVYEILPIISAMSNRIEKGLDAQGVATAIAIADIVTPREYQPLLENIEHTCPNCGFRFNSASKNPFCIFCRKYGWEAEEAGIER